MKVKSDKRKRIKKLSLKELKLPQGLKSLSVKQCECLCEEIRRILVETVSKNGGHLASNLGTVELTVAIHKVFDCPKDKIIWDVGHQAYTHKLLTGRLDKFSTLRQENGIGGFPKPSESKYDAFISGHSSNSISAACGIAKGMKLKGDNHHAVVVIGDGAFTGGMAYEGLNNAGKSDDNIIVILNHNDMSISKNVGAFANYLSSIRANPEYYNTKDAVEKFLDKTPVVGRPLKSIIKTSKSALKSVMYHSTMFEDFGFTYLGPVNGHDIEAVEKVLRTAKGLNRPVFVHVNTVKGKGYAPAEQNPGAFHGISKFDLKTGNPEVVSEDSYSAVFGKELCQLANYDDRICAVTAAMKYGTGLQYFSSEHHERFFDVGIAEQHAVTFCSGLARVGMVPVFAVYSSFLQRAYDQILHDTAIGNTHIVLGIDRAGIIGEDGETHQGLFDVSFLSAIPNVTIFSPSCYEEVSLCLNEAIYETDGIACVRYPRGTDSSDFDKTNLNTDYTLTKNNSDILAVSYGRIYTNLVNACKDLSVDILKLTKIFPFSQAVLEEISSYKAIVFFEEGMENGGIAEHLERFLSERGWRGKFRIVAVNEFVKQASVARSLEKYHLDSSSMQSILQEEISNA